MDWMAALAEGLSGGMQGYQWGKQMEGDEADRKAREEEAAHRRTLETSREGREAARFGWEGDDQTHKLSRRAWLDQVQDGRVVADLRNAGSVFDPATGTFTYRPTQRAEDAVAGARVSDAYTDGRATTERARIATALRGAGGNDREVAGFSEAPAEFGAMTNSRISQGNLNLNRSRFARESNPSLSGPSVANAVTLGVSRGGTPESAVSAAMAAFGEMGGDTTSVIKRNEVTAAVLDALAERAETTARVPRDMMGGQGTVGYPTLPDPNAPAAPRPQAPRPNFSNIPALTAPRAAPASQGDTAAPPRQPAAELPTGPADDAEITEARALVARLRAQGIPQTVIEKDVRDLYPEDADKILRGN